MKKRSIPILLLLTFWLSRGLCAQAHLSPASSELIEIAGNGDVAQVQQLLDAGADVNAQDGDGSTALVNAAWLSDIATVRLLLDRGAQVNAPKGGMTPLMVALRGYSKDADLEEKMATAKLLLEHGAHVQARDERGMTPLMWAAGSFGELQAVKWLLARGADVRARDKRGMTALQYAAGVHDMAVVRLLRARGARSR